MEELQALWREASAREEGQVSQAELESLVNHSSSDELNKFRQVIFMEYVGIWILIPVMVFGIFWRPEYQLLTASFLIFLVCLIYFYRRALRQFEQIHYQDSIQTYVQQALNFLKTYVRHYKILCWGSGGVGLVIGYFWKHLSEEEEELHLTASPTGDILLSIGLVGIAILFTHFYIKYLYQARIDNLEQLLAEFSEN